MKKLLLLIILLLIPFNVSALEYPSLHYQKAIVYDLTDNKTLYELNSSEKTSIASLTKIMTVITAIEKEQDLNKTVIYDQNMQNNVAWYASKAGFNVGDKLTFNDLLYGAMLPSGADATVALAITTSGSIEEFVKEMNTLSKKIGMTNSNFVNVHGLDEENHYSTAEDIKKLLEYALENETFKKVYTTKEYTLSTGNVIKSTVKKQSEKYDLNIEKIIGSKTGTTGNAGLCISVLMNYQDHEIIFITLGAPTDGNPYNVTDATELISFIENNYSNQILFSKNYLVKELTVENSKIDSYKIKTTKEINMFLENDYDKDKVKAQYTGINTLSYKNTKGEKLGVIEYYYNDQKIAEETIYLNKEIKADYLKIINSNKSIILLITIIIAITISILIKISKSKNKNINKEA